MTERTISETPTGSVKAYGETWEERLERIRRLGQQGPQIKLTPGQQRFLKRVQMRARQGAST